MGAGHPHAVTVSQLLPGPFHAIQDNAGRAFTYGVHVEIHAHLVEPLNDVRKPFSFKSGISRLMGIRIRRDHGCRMDLLGTVHEYLQGVNLQVGRVEFAFEAFELQQGLLRLVRVGERIASVNIDRQPALQVHLAKIFVYPLM